jgi:hypothetical protein
MVERRSLAQLRETSEHLNSAQRLHQCGAAES